MSNPYYLYTGGVLKLVDREEPSYFDHLDKNKYHNACEVWADYINALPSIAVSDDLKAKLKEGDRPVEGKDFVTRCQQSKCNCGNPFVGSDGCLIALPVNTLQEEKEEFLPPDHGDICWTKGAATFNRKEVFMLLWTQRAMIINDLKNYAGDDLTDKIYQVLNFPRKPEF